MVGGEICAYCCCAGDAICGAYAFAVEDGLGGAVVKGELMRGAAGPLGGGGGGVGVALAPYGLDGGGMERPCWFGKGEVIGFVTGVLLLAVGTLVTIGVSFQLVISLDFDGGGAEGVVFLGGAPKVC